MDGEASYHGEAQFIKSQVPFTVHDTHHSILKTDWEAKGRGGGGGGELRGGTKLNKSDRKNPNKQTTTTTTKAGILAVGEAYKALKLELWTTQGSNPQNPIAGTLD